MDHIDSQEIIKKYPWIIQREQYAILSPDTDGLLCGLLLSFYLDWKIVGYYDGKILLIKKGILPKECIFLDMEIFRKEIRSLGHHMVLYDKHNLPYNWDNFENCLQPNIIRNYDMLHNFSYKYPFGSIHLLLAILYSQIPISLSQKAFAPLIYVNGVFKNLFNFPENCLNWLLFLGGYKKESPLYQIFSATSFSISDLMKILGEFFKILSDIKKGRRKADRLIISNRRGEITNLLCEKNICSISQEEKIKVEKFISILAELIGWKYKPSNWFWDNFRVYKFKKRITKPTKKRYEKIIKQTPLSLAITSRNSLEYTLEKPDTLP